MNIVQSREEAATTGGCLVIRREKLTELVKLGKKLRDQGNAVLLDRNRLELYVWQIEEAE